MSSHNHVPAQRVDNLYTVAAVLAGFLILTILLIARGAQAAGSLHELNERFSKRVFTLAGIGTISATSAAIPGALISGVVFQGGQFLSSVFVYKVLTGTGWGLLLGVGFALWHNDKPVAEDNQLAKEMTR